MGGGKLGADREVLPIRQDVDGDEIDRFIDFAVAQPVFPDIGIGDGNGTWDLTERMVATRSAVVISPRNNTSLPTTTDVMTPGNSLTRRTTVEIWARFLSRSLPSQIPWMTFRPDFGRELGHLIQAIVDRVGPHTVGNLGELIEILGDLFRSDMGGRR